MPPVKLNIFQRGILQRAVTVFAYLGTIAVGAFILDVAEKRLFITTAQKAEQQGIITPEAFEGLKLLIESRDATTIFAVILIGLFCVVFGWFLMRWSAKRNWSWPVTLPRAVEFRSAMEQIEIVEPRERIDFVRKQKLPVFIALSPLVGREQNDVRAQYYAFAYDSSLGDSDIFERHIGKQTLCLDIEDYSLLLEKHGQKTKSAFSARIAELEQNVTDLKAVNSLQSADIARLTEENKKLLEENVEHRQKLKTLPGREGKAEKRENDKIPFWRVAAPLVNRLIAEAEPETKYSRRQIKEAFLQELEAFPQLKPAIQKLLHTSKKAEEGTPYDLDGWGLEAVRSALGDFAKKDSGAPRKG